MSTVTCKVIDFNKGLKYARKYGTFNPVTKTWEIDASWSGLNAPELYGLAKVQRIVANPTDPHFDLTRAMADEYSMY